MSPNVYNSASHATNNSSQINENTISMYSRLHANATFGLPPIQSKTFDITCHSLPKTHEYYNLQHLANYHDLHITDWIFANQVQRTNNQNW